MIGGDKLKPGRLGWEAAVKAGMHYSKGESKRRPIYKEAPHKL